MEELKVYHNHYYDSPSSIAEALQKIAEAPEEARDGLTDALYFLQAAAQNEYNPDYFRILYNVLQIITEKTL